MANVVAVVVAFEISLARVVAPSEHGAVNCNQLPHLSLFPVSCWWCDEERGSIHCTHTHTHTHTPPREYWLVVAIVTSVKLMLLLPLFLLLSSFSLVGSSLPLFTLQHINNVKWSEMNAPAPASTGRSRERSLFPSHIHTYTWDDSWYFVHFF